MDREISFSQRLLALDACAVSDAMDKLGLAGVVTGLAPQSVRRRIAGRVVTLKLGTGERAPGPVRHMGTAAIEAANAGDVIVVEQRTGIDAGSWGGILTVGAKARGIAGAIVDGPMRDVDEAIALDFPVYARACTARTARNRIVEKGTNVPIRLGEIDVQPGDYALADGSAVVFIPAAHVERVVEAAQAIANREAAMAQDIRDGRPITEVMGAAYEHLLHNK